MPTPDRVDVALWTTADRVLLEISDDGRGFDTSKINLTLGHGLANMQTRAHNAGGDVEITSEPGAGDHHPGLGASPGQ